MVNNEANLGPMIRFLGDFDESFQISVSKSLKINKNNKGDLYSDGYFFGYGMNEQKISENDV